jgi:hypothetical protein
LTADGSCPYPDWIQIFRPPSSRSTVRMDGTGICRCPQSQRTTRSTLKWRSPARARGFSGSPTELVRPSSRSSRFVEVVLLGVVPVHAPAHGIELVLYFSANCAEALVDHTLVVRRQWPIGADPLPRGQTMRIPASMRDSKPSGMATSMRLVKQLSRQKSRVPQSTSRSSWGKLMGSSWNSRASNTPVSSSS